MPEKTKADDNGPVKEFDFEQWLKEGVEGVKSKVEGERPVFDFSNVRKHVRNAQREQLMAMRSFIDSAIDWLEKEPEEKNKA